jgi:type III secretion protein U
MSLAAVGFAVLLSLLANVAQVGFVWAPGALCKADHIDPTKNIVQMVSPEQLLQVPLNLLKVAVIGSCFAYAVYRSLESVVHMADGTLEQAFEVALRLATYCYRSTLIALIVFAIIDWMLRRHFFMKQMMMDEEEVERENKEQYGEKHVRSHRKRMMHEMVMGGAERRRKPPNAVVTNPTHFAIGLRYVPSECPLPIVIERTRDQAALDLIREAKEAGIPIVRSIWLARTLYAVGKEDHVIPRITLKAVAAVYRAIIEVTMKEGVVREVLHVDERY